MLDSRRGTVTAQVTYTGRSGGLPRLPGDRAAKIKGPETGPGNASAGTGPDLCARLPNRGQTASFLAYSDISQPNVSTR